jgi:ribonuclease HI
MTIKKNEIIVYTDGSSLGNPGPGGWGALLLFPEQNNSNSKVESEKFKVVELGGREKESTNNRMEMMASIMALKEIEKRKIKAGVIKIHTDSAYLLNGITMWIHGWVKNNWKTKADEDVLNKDLWEILYKVEMNLKNKYEIEWVKVVGHAGVFLNERCDVIATSFSADNTGILFTGTLANYEKLFGKIDQEILETKTKKKSSKNKSSKTAYSYVSAVSEKVHADKTWAECEKRVKGKSGAKYKKVFSKEEEQELVAEWTLKSLF